MTDIKAREFWIEWDGKSFQAFIDTKPIQATYSWRNIYRVVEKEYAEKLEIKLKIAVEALEAVRSKTVTDPAHEVELRARAAFVYKLVIEALAKIGDVS